MDEPLFRREVLDRQHEGEQSEILLAKLPTLATLAVWMLVAVVAIVAFLAFGHYTRKQRVSGVLVPHNGLIDVRSPRPGIVTALHVQEGQSVKRGDVLCVISSEQLTGSGEGAQSRVVNEMKSRRSTLGDDHAHHDEQARIQSASLAGKARELQSQLKHLDSEIATQQEQIALDTQFEKRLRILQKSKYVSDLEMLQKRSELAEKRARIESLLRQRITLQRDLRETVEARKDLTLTTAMQASANRRDLSLLDENLIQEEARRQIVVVAPIDGDVIDIAAHEGQAVAAEATVVSMVPQHAELQADLYAPSRAIGFVREGQPVHLRYHAYPYQNYGYQTGRIVSVSRAPLRADRIPYAVSRSEQEPMYKIEVKLDAQSIDAEGRSHALRIGMGVDSDIILERRRLLDWVTRPLERVAGPP